ncbi:MAG TPA: rhomboid family intramembrane serine protease [Mesorhizobium sp.]
MFIPLYDTNHLRTIRLQYVTFVLIGINVAVYLATTIGGENFNNAAVLGLSFIPSVVHHKAELAPQFVIIPENLSYLTYAFLHADIFHLGGNMLFLWVFGDNVEDALGHFRYLLFYVACAIGGAAFQGLIAPDSQTPLIGASGAIAGVVVAYLILYPRVKIWILAFSRIPLHIPAYIPLALWILVQFVMFGLGGDEQISWACHIGGILSGTALVLLLRRRNVPLTDEVIVTPEPVEATDIDG